MGIVKMAGYALIGYTLYELFQGISANAPQLASAGRTSGQRQGQGRDSDDNSKRVSTEDSSGASSSHRVGRGVTH